MSTQPAGEWAQPSMWHAPMGQALNLAATAGRAGEVPVGAVVVCDGVVVAGAGNSRELSHDPLGHAEILALRAAGLALGRWRLWGCTLVVTLEPCPMCAGAIVNSRIDRVVFGAYDRRAGAVGSIMDLTQDARLNHRAQVVPAVRHDECRALLQAFFAERRAVKESNLSR